LTPDAAVSTLEAGLEGPDDSGSSRDGGAPRGMKGRATVCPSSSFRAKRVLFAQGHGMIEDFSPLARSYKSNGNLFQS
jgi:hypothetical protein